MRKWLSALLAVMLMLSTFAMPAFAEEGGKGEWIFELPEVETSEAEMESAAPGVPDGLDKTIFGTDDRITVSNPAQYPYSAIAYIVMKYECGCRGTGSGFLGGTPYTVFTAAHCVVCDEHGKWAEELTFYFGYKNSRNYLYRYNGQWYAYAGNTFPDKQYTTSHDYAVIKLYEDVGDRTGWLGLRWCSTDSELSSFYSYTAGYRDEILRYDQGFVSPSGSDHYTHQMDWVPGNSGGPLFTSDNYAIGINIAYNNVHNIGYRLTYDVYDVYQALKNQ